MKLRKNSLYNMGGKCYANGSTVTPNYMQPQQQNYMPEEWANDTGSDFNYTKMAAKAGLNPAALGATGGLSALAIPLGFAADAFQWKNQMGQKADMREQNAFYKQQVQNQTSPYNQEGGYMQGNYNKGGGVGERRYYPGWNPYSSNPSLFQMNQNNNNSPGYNYGGEVGDDDYGVIPGNGNPKADDKKMNAENGAFVVPNENVDIAKGILSLMGYNPQKKMPTMNPAQESNNPGSPINISSKEMYLSPEMKEKMQLFSGMDNRQFEKTLSPDSQHNQYYATGGGIGEVQDQFSDWWYNNMRTQSYRDENLSRTQARDFNDDLTPQDTFTPRDQMEAENQASQNFDYQQYNNPYNAPLQQPPVSPETQQPGTPNPAAAAPVKDDMVDQYNKVNRNMFIANTATGVGKGIYNLMQKYQDIPKPQQYQPEQFDSNFSAMGEQMNRGLQKAGATARYNARNYAQNPVTNSAINANEIQGKIDIASRMQQAENEQNYKNTENRNQASLYNLGMNNQWAQNNSMANQQFRQAKANALSNNIDTVLKGYQNYGNAKLGINALEKGYNVAGQDQQLFNKATTNPGSLTQQEIDRINMLTGGNLTLEALQTK